MAEKPRKPDEAVVPGGAFIQGGRVGDDEKHYGGRVVNANGETIAEFADDEVNTGRPRDMATADQPKADATADGKAATPPAPAATFAKPPADRPATK